MILNVLYQSDDNYAMVSAISIASLLENNKHLDEINVYYLNYKIKNINQNKINTLVKKYNNAHIYFIDAKAYHDTFQKINVKPWHGVYVTWLKMLGFDKIDINTDRILFINGHTVINGALDELITLDFKNNLLALSYDALTNAHKKTIGLKDSDGYYNCGIMLVNYSKWKKDNIDTYVKSKLLEKSDYLIADQDLCNVIFKGKILTLNSTYNFSSAYYAYDLKSFLKINDLKSEYFYSYKEIMENYYSPKIVHSLFGITGKPWEQGNQHPQRYLWEKYLYLTPWKNSNRPRAKKSFNWFLYNLLPQFIFIRLYIYAVNKKFAQKTN